jgi:hypothetical protein
MVPPGITDFFTRRRVVDAGPVRLRGRAWSGTDEIARVEVGIDGVWRDAALAPVIDRYAWRGWTFDWQATPGEHELASCATDRAGRTQPADVRWNYQGMCNNVIQRMAVAVR